jgi:hypothetical protein
VRRCVRASINVSRISCHIKMWDRIVKHWSVGFQNVPSTLRDPVATLLAVDSGKVKRPMDIGVRVSEVHIFAIREEFVLVSLGLGCIWRPNVVSVCWSGGTNDVIMAVILEPELLVITSNLKLEGWGRWKSTR